MPVKARAECRRGAGGALCRFAGTVREQKTGLAHAASYHPMRLAHEVLPAAGGAVGVGAVGHVPAQRGAGLVRAEVGVPGRQRRGGGARRRAAGRALRAARGHAAQLAAAAAQRARARLRRVRVAPVRQPRAHRLEASARAAGARLPLQVEPRAGRTRSLYCCPIFTTIVVATGGARGRVRERVARGTLPADARAPRSGHACGLSFAKHSPFGA